MRDQDKTKAELIRELDETRRLASERDDIESELKRATEALHSFRSRYQSLFDLSHDGIVVVRPEGEIIRANQAFAEAFGFERKEDAIGVNVRELFSDSTGWEELRGKIQREGGLNRFEWRAQGKDGREREFLITCSVETGGTQSFMGYQAIVRDVTELKKSIEILQHTDRMNALREVAGAMSYNLRNLLQIIVGSTRLAVTNLESGNTAEVKSNLDQILGSLRSARETARLLSHFAGAKRDRGGKRGQVFDLSRAVEKAIEVGMAWLEGDPEKEKVKINLKSSLKRGCLVKGVENELLEVVFNLLSNAADALPDGGEIKLATWMEEGNVLLTVSDNGIGIPKEDLGKVFQPFWTTKGALATGLGLASSFGIVAHHGGTISVESEPGKGTSFLVTLRLAEPTHERTEVGKTQRIDFSYRILVVDDLKPLLRILSHGLIRRGQTVFAASSGEEALDIFEANQVDVVICDLAMPEMNGWQVCLSMKKMCEDRGIPKPVLIILTGWGGQVNEQQRISESGVDRVLEKPVDIPNLLRVIRELVETRSVSG